MGLTQFETGGGVRVRRTATPFDPALLEDITRQVEARRGGVLSSGMEYPGRYSRWHMAYVDPCIELVARGRQVTATALNDRGQILLPVIGDAMRRAGDEVGPGAPAQVEVVIPEPAGTFTEEERSRRPTVFSALRQIIAAFCRAGPAPGPLRRVRVRPGVPVRAGAAPAHQASGPA